MPNTKDKLTKKRLNFSSIKKKDHSNFYHFICWFSMFDATDMTNTYINSKYPKLTSKIEDVFAWRELVSKSMEELQSPLPLLSKTMVYYNVRNTKCIDLLRHLRNAFAHDNVVYDKKKKIFHCRRLQ